MKYPEVDFPIVLLIAGAFIYGDCYLHLLILISISHRERFEDYFKASENSLGGNHPGGYEHQVAGHTKEGSCHTVLYSLVFFSLIPCSITLFLLCVHVPMILCVVIRSLGDSLILKPMIKPALFLRELALYEEMYSYKSIYLPTPKSFTPEYFGVTTVQSEKNGLLPYMVLRNLSETYTRPCVMDIKMGQRTYEPTATQEKKDREVKKCKYQEEMGFRITGFKVYDIMSQSYRSFDKVLGRTVSPDYVKVIAVICILLIIHWIHMLYIL
mgnify:CR=1 FL=1